MAANYFVTVDGISYLFTWAGAKINRTIRLILQHFLSNEISNNHIYVSNVTHDDITHICNQETVDPMILCDQVPFELKVKEKYDNYLSNHLLNLEYCASYLDVDGAMKVLRDTIRK